MTTVNRKEFLAELSAGDGYIDIDNLDPETQRTLDSAGVSRERLAAVAGDDRVISGSAEMKKLFALVDEYDANGSAASFDSGTDQFASASGELYAAFKREVQDKVALAHATGIEGAGAREMNVKRMTDRELTEEADAVRKRLATGNYPTRDADAAWLAELEGEIYARFETQSPVKDPFAHGDGTSWAERQTGRCMTNLEIYQYTLEHGETGLSPELEAELNAAALDAQQPRLWPDGTVDTREDHAKRVYGDYVRRGLDALTANPFGAIAWGIAGQFTSDPYERLAWAEMGANAGDMAIAAGWQRTRSVSIVRAPLEYEVATPAYGVHGNAKESTRPNHIYVITATNVKTGKTKIVKYGVGSNETIDGMSKRAEKQVRAMNAKGDGWTYSSVIIDRTPPNRAEAYNIERDYVTEYVARHPRKEAPPENKLPHPWPGNQIPDRPWQDPK